MKRTCECCKWFDVEHSCECRKNPPVTLVTWEANELSNCSRTFITKWPEVEHHDWCGEFEELEEQAE